MPRPASVRNGWNAAIPALEWGAGKAEGGVVVRDIAFGLFLLVMGLFLAWLTAMQIRTRDVTGETIFDLVAAVIPPLRRPMFWASTIFLGLLALLGFTGAVAFFMKAMGLS